MLYEKKYIKEYICTSKYLLRKMSFLISINSEEIKKCN